MRTDAMRRGLTDRMHERRQEIERAMLLRVRSIADPAATPGSEYTDALPAVVSAAVEYGIEALERSEDNPAPIPTALLSQARLATRHGVRLETVLRRYLAGYTLLGDFLIEESEQGGPFSGVALKRLLRIQAAVLDRLVAAVSEEYAREVASRNDSAEQRLVEMVDRLLAGQRLDTSAIPYDFDLFHLGVLSKGAGVADALRAVSADLDLRLFLVPRPEGPLWAWIGSRHELQMDQVDCRLSELLPAGTTLAVGEPAQGIEGWRITHRQACAALPVALRHPRSFVRYGDIALVASMMQDDLLVASLQAMYLVPLEDRRGGGAILCATACAYLAADRNISSAAAALQVNRHTVAQRLRVIEDRLGQPLSRCAAELDAALRLRELMQPPHPIPADICAT